MSSASWSDNPILKVTRRVKTMTIGEARYFEDSGIGISLCGERKSASGVVSKDYLLYSPAATVMPVDESLIEEKHRHWWPFKGKMVAMPASIGFITVVGDQEKIALAILKGRQEVQSMVDEPLTMERLSIAQLAMRRGSARRNRGGRVTIGVIRAEYGCSHDYATYQMECLHVAGWANVTTDEENDEQYILVERLPEVIRWMK